MNDGLHALAVATTAAAGLLYLQAARRQWLMLARGPADARWWWLGFALQTAGLLVSLLDHGHRSFAYGALAAWAAMAALLYASTFLAAPVRLLLAVPLGALALLTAVAGGLAVAPDERSAHWLPLVHAACMAAQLAAMTVAGASAGLYLLAASLLKAGNPLATRLPALPALERLIERGLVWGTALLIAGIALGGAAMRLSDSFRLLHPTALLGILELLCAAGALAWYRLQRCSRRSLALAAALCAAIAVAGSLSQVLLAHG
ncbi:MAG: hypothetical protein RMM29_06660 [Planctomycetota bacterium]|nr:hypothetical protein [Planctomycetota bacterium]MCX8039415.1 hypothetical protein [Planctomycetota bacterium]MDW8373310.1 hypothetical protein [Planctomycetota bacterium]